MPTAAARAGMQFLSAKLPHASPRVVTDFLRTMNKIWLRRERRALKRIKAAYKHEINDMKRQLSNARFVVLIAQQSNIRSTSKFCSSHLESII